MIGTWKREHGAKDKKEELGQEEDQGCIESSSMSVKEMNRHHTENNRTKAETEKSGSTSENISEGTRRVGCEVI